MACTSIIPNEYVKLIVVMIALGYGLFGIMKGMSHHNSEEVAEADGDKNGK